MTFILGFISAILMVCIFSAIVHGLRWIEDVFQGTIHAVETETDDYSLDKAREKVARSTNQTRLSELIKAFDNQEHDIEVYGKSPKKK